MIATRPGDTDKLREGGRRLAGILQELASAVRPGLVTADLDALAERRIREAGGDPVFKGYRARRGERPFPASICTSINDEVVHAIPSRAHALQAGDIIGIDIGMRWPSSADPARSGTEGRPAGLITDTAVTVPVGAVDPASEKLLAVTASALQRGIAVIRAGIRMGDLGHAIQQVIEAAGFFVVRGLVGHGVGRNLHEDPYVPNYGTPGEGMMLREGMVLAIEPMAAAGDPEVRLDPDGWTWRTRGGSRAAHFEHTVIITTHGAEVLTAAS